MPGPAVTAKIEAWRDQVLAWFVANPGATSRQQNVEASLTAGELDRLLGDMWDYREADPDFQRFPQTLPALGQPTDRWAAFDHGFVLPWWGDVTIDEWEGPGMLGSPPGKGTHINFWAWEGIQAAPTDLYMMSMQWFPGTIGNNFREETMGWNLQETP